MCIKIDSFFSFFLVSQLLSWWVSLRNWTEGSRLPITQASSSNQNMTVNSPCEKSWRETITFSSRAKVSQHRVFRWLVDSEQNLQNKYLMGRTQWWQEMHQLQSNQAHYSQHAGMRLGSSFTSQHSTTWWSDQKLEERGDGVLQPCL